MTVWIDVILALMVAEGAGLLAWRRWTGRGPRPILPNLLAGASLLLALRLALDGAAAAWIGVALLAGLAAHLADLRGRWESA